MPVSGAGGVVYVNSTKPLAAGAACGIPICCLCVFCQYSGRVVGMEISLDIGSLVLGVVTAIVLPSIVWVMNRERRASEGLQREQEDKYRKSQRAYNELKEAFSIHASLTEPAVITALAQVQNDESARKVLVALHTRSSHRFEAFSDEFSIPEDVTSMIADSLQAIHDVLPGETEDAQQLFDQKVQKQNHEKNESVQTRVAEFAQHLVGAPLERGQADDVAPEYRDVLGRIRMTRPGQSVEFTLPDGETRLWFAGNGKGELPVGLGHSGRNGCQLNSSKAGRLKSRLVQHNETGKDLAEAFISGLRELAATQEHCSCGAPLRFS